MYFSKELDDTMKFTVKAGKFIVESAEMKFEIKPIESFEISDNDQLSLKEAKKLLKSLAGESGSDNIASIFVSRFFK